MSEERQPQIDAIVDYLEKQGYTVQVQQSGADEVHLGVGGKEFSFQIWLRDYYFVFTPFNMDEKDKSDKGRLAREYVNCNTPAIKMYKLMPAPAGVDIFITACEAYYSSVNEFLLHLDKTVERLIEASVRYYRKRDE